MVKPFVSFKYVTRIVAYPDPHDCVSHQHGIIAKQFVQNLDVQIKKMIGLQEKIRNKKQKKLAGRKFLNF